MEKREIYEKHRKFLVPCVANYYEEPLILDRGKGKYLYDIDGKEYSRGFTTFDNRDGVG
jgi:4-aminobutyrate aminotransferase-like enzyme